MTVTTRRLLLMAVAFALGAALPARAERLVFQREKVLYAAGADGKEVRRLFALTEKDPYFVRWAPSPDGRRVAWAAPLKEPAVGGGLSARPFAVYVSDLSGERRKRLLTTDNLRDRQGRKVTELWVGKASFGDTWSADGGGSFEDWGLSHLAWSADGKSLYLSCGLVGTKGGNATFVVDAATGAAVVDAQGRWKSIAPITEVDAGGTLLVGVAQARAEDGAVDASGKYAPLLVIDLAEGRNVLLPPALTGTQARPAYAAARFPALSPDRKTVAFASNGLWLLDIAPAAPGRSYRRLTDGPGDMPRWSPDGKRVLFLVRKPDGSPFGAGEVYALPVPTAAGDKRRLLLSNVDRFFVIPD